MEKENISCSVCDKIFTQKKNLYAHLRKVHQTEPQLTTKSQLKCVFCQSKFSCNSSLNRHVNKFHKPESDNDHDYCLDAPTRQSRILCPYEKCDKVLPSNNQLRKHLSDEHNITIESDVLSFGSIQEFENWKDNIQQETFSMYTLDTAIKTLSNKTTKRYYNCHRSFQYIGKGNKKRAMKSMGSNKINKACPSKMEVTVSEKSVFVQFWKTHCGHVAEIGRITLDKNTRAEIAEKLYDGVALEHILDTIRDAQSDKNVMARVSLLERQDLHNIARDYNIEYSTKRHQDDAVSIRLWVNEMTNLKEDCPVLYYKGQNETDDSDLEKQDFILIIMTNFQVQQMLKFGHDKICIDGTHGTNAYDIQLYTLMIVDEFQNGCPVAYCFTNRADEKVFRLFYDKIKSKVGVIKASIFMTDDYPAFYNAWKNVMDSVPNRLLCTWHIDRNWRVNLRKIRGSEKQALVYKCLRVLLEITSVEEFVPHLNQVLDNLLSDEDTHAFGKYFQKEYYSRPECWAYCYRLGLGINTNMYLESFHKILKHIYLQGKNVKRLDQSIDALMKLTRDSYFKRLIKLAKHHSTDKMRDINRSHKTSETIELKYVEIIEQQKSWIVPSTKTSDHKYYINLVQDTCNTSCLKCIVCNICIHTFKCSCTDNVIKMNICKHIHFCAQQFFPSSNNSRNEEAINNEISKISHLQPTSCSAINNKQKIIKKMELILSLSNTVSIGDEDINLIEKKLDQIIQIINKKDDMHLEPVEHVNVKKNISKQTRSYKKTSQKQIFKKKKHRIQVEEEEVTGKQNVIEGTQKMVHATPQDSKPRLFSTKKKIKKSNALKKPSLHEKIAIKAGLSNPNYESINIHSNFDHSYIENDK